MAEETITIPASALPPEKGAEYAAAMIARAEGKAPPVEPEKKTEETPALIAGKFKSQDDLVKAYAELEKKLGAPKVEAPKAPVVEEKKPLSIQAPQPNAAQVVADKAATDAETAATAAASKAAGKDATDADKAAAWQANEALKTAKGAKEAADKAATDAATVAAQKTVEGAGLDWNALTAEFSEKGALEATSYETLEKAGIPKAMVDQFIEGQVAVAERARNEIFNTVGGQEKYVEMVGWAAKSLSADEQATYNAMVNGADRNAAKLAVAGLQAKFAASGATDPNLIGGGSPAGTTGYASKAEMTKDMADPRYAKDPAFRQQVMNKLRLAKF